jgi:aspartate aminotransferase-like enzyme
MVDSAQTAGVFPIDVQSMCIDMLAFAGHKGLLGPQGVGGLYIIPVKQNLFMQSTLACNFNHYRLCPHLVDVFYWRRAFLCYVEKYYNS